MKTSHYQACANLPLKFANLDNANLLFLSLHWELICKLLKIASKCEFECSYLHACYSTVTLIYSRIMGHTRHPIKIGDIMNINWHANVNLRIYTN